MTTIFAEGFESGTLANFSKTNLTNGTAAVVTPGYKGTYCGHFVTTANLKFCEATARKTLAGDEIYARAYVKVNKGATSLGKDDRFYFIYINGSDGNYHGIIGLRREALNPMKWCLAYRSGVSGTTFTYTHVYGTTVYDATNPFPTGWVCVEMHYSKSQGKYEVFIDGKLEITVSSIAAATFPPTANANFGIYKPGTAVPPTTYDPTTAYDIDVLVDQIKVADTGPIGTDPLSCADYTTQAACTAAGCYWYNNMCNSTPQVLTCEQHTDQASCVNAGCYWYGGACHTTPPTCEQLTDQASCTNAGCYWYNGACHTSPQTTPPNPHCFIATAAYGTPFAKEINVLRAFRDNFMLLNKVGTVFVSLYYTISPPIARFIAERPKLRWVTRTLLNPIVKKLKHADEGST